MGQGVETVTEFRDRKRHRQKQRVCCAAVAAQRMSVTDKGRKNPTQHALPAHLLLSLRNANIHDTETAQIHEKLQQRTCSQMQSYLQLCLIRLRKMHISGNGYIEQLIAQQQRDEFAKGLKARVQHVQSD
jgi:hypothetical protein